MAEKYGVENIKEGLSFAIKLGIQISKTKKFNIISILGFIDDLAGIAEIIQIWPQIKLEYADRSPAEKAEIHAFVRDEFDIPNDQVEGVIEDSFEVCDGLVSLVGRIKKLKKK